MKTARKKKIDAYVVSLDETNNYNLDPRESGYIQSIMGVYLFDGNERTCCCEFTSSYDLLHLYDEVIFNEEGNKLSEEEKSVIYDIYENCGGEDKYVHCHAIDGMKKHHHGSTGIKYSETNYDEQIEELREHFCSNHVT
jgi:hypothetical protein